MFRTANLLRLFVNRKLCSVHTSLHTHISDPEYLLSLIAGAQHLRSRLEENTRTTGDKGSLREIFQVKSDVA